MHQKTLLLAVLLLAAPLDAAQKPAAAFDTKAFLSRAAGVYKARFRNALVGGETYESEDVLEVVPVSDTAAYVRMDLEFSNGHSGRIYGIATYGSHSLIYDNRAEGDRHCVVEYVWSADSVVTRANYDRTPGCSVYHGARGSLEGAKFSVKRKQTIRYMERLKNSPEFAEAMEAYRSKVREQQETRRQQFRAEPPD